MSYDVAATAEVIADTLADAVEGAVAVYAKPPPTFNGPALIVAWPTTIERNTPAFGVDLATVSVLAAVGPEEMERGAALMGVATAALEADRTLGGVLAHGALVVSAWRAWRIVTVAGSHVLLAELILEIRA